MKTAALTWLHCPPCDVGWTLLEGRSCPWCGRLGHDGEPPIRRQLKSVGYTRYEAAARRATS